MKKTAGKPTEYRYIKYWSEQKNDWHFQAVSKTAFENFCKRLDENSTRWMEISKDEYPYTHNTKTA